MDNNENLEELEGDKIDSDIEETEKKETYGGVETDDYSVLPEVEPDEEVEKSLEGKIGTEVIYSFNGEEVEEGLTIYQAAFLTKKNLIYSAILLAVFFVYLINIIKNPSEVFSAFLAVMCVTVLCFIWILPKLHIKKSVKAANQNELGFSMTIYDDCIKMGGENGSYIVSFNKEIKKVFETANLFLICAGKEMLFILPKRCFENGVEKKVREIFKTAMKDEFIVK